MRGAGVGPAGWSCSSSGKFRTCVPYSDLLCFLENDKENTKESKDLLSFPNPPNHWQRREKEKQGKIRLFAPLNDAPPLVLRKNFDREFVRVSYFCCLCVRVLSLCLYMMGF